VTKPPLEFAWRSDRGRVRARNEDAVACMPESGIVVVADGIGGASAARAQLVVLAWSSMAARRFGST